MAEQGLHGLSHRAVDEAAEVPRGTTSNYFRSREALVAAAIQRIVDLHFALIAELRAQYADAGGAVNVADFLGDVVDHALTRYPGRYLAMLELALECARKPELREVLDRITADAMGLTRAAHRVNDTEPSREDVELLGAFYNGMLFTSLVMPQTLGARSPGEITRTMIHKVLEPSPAGSRAARSARSRSTPTGRPR
ncbi:TetR/AcrR family transcriptional regulator [Mycobacterium lacus]|uniref:TetR/AcrR family transcriptional regulator n=1 Tax=Mycobacterium lacus TaxID=169765 RepID=UPI0013D71A56|nr:TetR/AcrR family transcriptional regulator [Mycobacterium lacus]MCV7124274.1 TetR family transcriptional regulator [Mycobacterium lacus]